MAEESSEGSTFPLSLRPWPGREAEEDDLKTTIERVFQERGHFRYITEEGLAEEIAKASEEGEEDKDEQKTEEEDESDYKARREKLQAAKMEMLQDVSRAQQEILMAQDLVSALLRKDTEPEKPGAPARDKVKQGSERSMTDYVFQNTPANAMGIKEAVPSAESAAKREAREKEDMEVAVGSRLKSLEGSADALMGAAQHLNKEVAKENNYWEQIVSIKENGWPVTRLPRDPQNLAVRFNFQEARGPMRYRGLAPLRADDQGNIVLDEALTSQAKAIRVRVSLGDKIVGSSHLRTVQSQSEIAIEDRIRRARDSLFEEELFQEMTRESHSLLNYGIAMKENVIEVPCTIKDADNYELPNPPKMILIDLIVRDEVPAAQPMEADKEAQAIYLALKFLLSHEHEKRLERRSQIPPPISDTKRKEPLALILQPLVNYLEHQSALEEIYAELSKLKAVVTAAGAAIFWKVQTISPEIPSQSSVAGLSDLVGKLIAPPETKITLSMRRRSASETIECAMLKVRTGIGSPLFGTVLTLEALNKAPTTPNQRPTDYRRVEELMEAVNDILGMTFHSSNGTLADSLAA
ncbi:MAG: RNA polymerase II mediator complex subunit [Bogoriella megaspora]|nr:MAG: RNA polymerase II mediator complex subunit [Bogoriella megaspora]